MSQSDVQSRTFGRRILPLVAMVGLGIGLSGCATAIVGSITLGQISAAAGVASMGTTGKGLQDHALSLVTGQDCRLLEGIFRADRRICEEPGSLATQTDFAGVVVMLLGPREENTEDTPQAEPEVVYAGLASDYRPTMARGMRRSRVLTAAELPVHMASFTPPQANSDQPMMRPVTSAETAITEVRLEPAFLEPAVLDAEFALMRTERQTGANETGIALADASELPAVLDWAMAQPAPTITTVRLATDF